MSRIGKKPIELPAGVEFSLSGNTATVKGPKGELKVDLPEGRRYRVQVGQFPTEADAQAAASRLDTQYRLQSFVVRDDG